MSTKKTVSLKSPQSARAGDQSANRKMLSLVRDELKSDIRGLDRKMDSRFSDLDAKFDRIDARFGEMNARFGDMDAKFLSVDSQFEGLNGKLA